VNNSFSFTKMKITTLFILIFNILILINQCFSQSSLSNCVDKNGIDYSSFASQNWTYQLYSNTTLLWNVCEQNDICTKNLGKPVPVCTVVNGTIYQEIGSLDDTSFEGFDDYGKGNTISYGTSYECDFASGFRGTWITVTCKGTYNIVNSASFRAPCSWTINLSGPCPGSSSSSEPEPTYTPQPTPRPTQTPTPRPTQTPIPRPTQTPTSAPAETSSSASSTEYQNIKQVCYTTPSSTIIQICLTSNDTQTVCLNENNALSSCINYNNNIKTCFTPNPDGNEVCVTKGSLTPVCASSGEPTSSTCVYVNPNGDPSKSRPQVKKHGNEIDITFGSSSKLLFNSLITMILTTFILILIY